MEAPSQVTALLRAYGAGDRRALDRLMPLVYEQLREMARARLRNERPDHSLNTTGLVHEAYLRLVNIDRVRWKDRSHFLALASGLMRRILVDAARRRNARVRGGGRKREPMPESRLLSAADARTLCELDDCLRRLEREHPRQAKAAEHVYFGGLTGEEAAAALGISLPTVERDLQFARAWLSRTWDA